MKTEAAALPLVEVARPHVSGSRSGLAVRRRALDEVGPDPSEAERRAPDEIRRSGVPAEQILMQPQIKFEGRPIAQRKAPLQKCYLCRPTCSLQVFQ